MTRAQALVRIRAAGAEGDRRAFVRLYVENRVSIAAATEAWNEGVRLAQNKSLGI